MPMTPERITQLRRLNRQHQDEIEAIITIAMCEAYKEVTGKKASIKFEEAIAEAIRYEAM